VVNERVALYRYLLGADAALEEHRRLRHAFDRATEGRHQTSSRRRAQLRAWHEHRDSMAESNYELPAASAVRLSPDFALERSMNIFEFRDHIIHDYATYIKSFIQIRDTRISEYAGQHLNAGILWPEPLIQLNPAFEPGEWIETLVTQGVLHPECTRIFRKDKDAGANRGDGKPLRLHRHQVEAIYAALTGENYVLTTGTGSGKSLAYIVPIVNHVLRRGSGKGIQTIVVYPMNALANSQHGELEKFLCHGYAEGTSPVTFARYTGQETDDERAHISAKPPDILLTNYVMLGDF